MSEMNIWHHPISDPRDDALIFDCHIIYDFNLPNGGYKEEDRKMSMNSLNKFLIITGATLEHPDMLKMKMIINGTEYNCNDKEDVRKIRSLIHFYGLPDL